MAALVGSRARVTSLPILLGAGLGIVLGLVMMGLGSLVLKKIVSFRG